MKDYHAFKSTSGGSGGGGGGGFGCSICVIITVVLLLIFFVGEGAGIEAIDTLLGLGFLVFLLVRSVFR